MVVDGIGNRCRGKKRTSGIGRMECIAMAANLARKMDVNIDGNLRTSLGRNLIGKREVRHERMNRGKT